MFFSDSDLSWIQVLIDRYPEGKQKSALIPVLHFAQEKNAGWLSTAVMDEVAEVLKLKPIEVYEVATFYSMFNTKPIGKYLLEVCQTGPCMLRGCDDIIAHISNKLGIKVGETTTNGLFTLKAVECLGACGYAPMMQIGKHYHEFLTKDSVDNLLNSLS